MTLIVILVFLGVFGVVVLIAAASGTGATEQTRAIMTRLESAIAVGKPEMADLIVDVRKNELMSSIPWLDRYLSKLELAPRIRRFLYQANVKWTVGGLSLFCAALLRCAGLPGLPAHGIGSLWSFDRAGGRSRAPHLCQRKTQEADEQV